MKDYKIATLRGYCCPWDDGPYSLWKNKKHIRKLGRRRVREQGKKEVRNARQEINSKNRQD